MDDVRYHHACKVIDDLVATPKNYRKERLQLLDLARFNETSNAMQLIVSGPLQPLRQALLDSDLCDRLSVYAHEKKAYDIAAIAAHCAHNHDHVTQVFTAWVTDTADNLMNGRPAENELFTASKVFAEISRYNKAYRARPDFATLANTIYGAALSKGNMLQACVVLSKLDFPLNDENRKLILARKDRLKECLTTKGLKITSYRLAGRLAGITPDLALKNSILSEFVKHAYDTEQQEAVGYNRIILEGLDWSAKHEHDYFNHDQEAKVFTPLTSELQVSLQLLQAPKSKTPASEAPSIALEAPQENRPPAPESPSILLE